MATQHERAIEKLFETCAELRAEIGNLKLEIALIKLKIAFVSGLCGIAGSAITLIVGHYWK